VVVEVLGGEERSDSIREDDHDGRPSNYEVK